MFDIFTKRSKVVVDAFTYDESVFTKYPISKNIMPSWWKDTASSFSVLDNGKSLKVGTLKRCDGLLALINETLYIPAWGDIKISSNSTECTIVSDNVQIQNHLYNQIPYKISEAYNHYKLVSPWHFSEKRGIKFLLFEQTWNLIGADMHPLVVPGILEFKYQNGTNINILCRHGANTDISAGTAIAGLIPLSEKSIDLKVHLVSIEEFNTKNSMLAVANRTLGDYKKVLKGSTCPYHK